MEGQPLLARRLLKQRADGNVRLRDDDNQKVGEGNRMSDRFVNRARTSDLLAFFF